MIRQVSRLLLRPVNAIAATNISKMSSLSNLETLKVTTPKENIYHVELNRPDKVNALNLKMWSEIQTAFDDLSVNPDCRVIVLSGSGKLFTGGIDFKAFMGLGQDMAEEEDLARKAKIVLKSLSGFQKNLSSIELCQKPVIAAIHNGCIGAGVDMITSTCIRYCTKDAYFQVKEILLGMAADVGTLQRLPKIIGNQSLVRELCYTGRVMKADEALSAGLVSRVFADKDAMMAGTMEVAQQIAKLSPVAMQASKASLLYSRDHTVQDGLYEIGVRNQFLLQSEDFMNSVMHAVSKAEGDCKYSKL